MDDIKNGGSCVKIDLTRCGGHARCIDEASEIFGYDDKTNKAYVIDGADLEANREAIERAIWACPERSISWSSNGGN